MLKRIIMMIVLAAIVAPLVGCNTTEGMGKDMERGGEKMQDAAERNK